MTTPPADYATMRGIIAITRAMLRAQPGNARAREFIEWVDGLQREPTDAEFAAWCKSRNIKLRSMKGKGL